MYGIITEDGSKVLHYGTTANSYVLKNWDRRRNMVMMGSALEIDQLMQDFMVNSGRFDLTVFAFTEEQEQYLIISRLSGY